MSATKLAVEMVNGNPAERILVIARTYREFVYWCRENDIDHHAASVRCVLRQEHLRGYRDDWYAFLGAPDGIEGEQLMRLFNHMKAAGRLKNAEATQRGPEEES